MLHLSLICVFFSKRLQAQVLCMIALILLINCYTIMTFFFTFDEKCRSKHL